MHLCFKWTDNFFLNYLSFINLFFEAESPYNLTHLKFTTWLKITSNFCSFFSFPSAGTIQELSQLPQKVCLLLPTAGSIYQWDMMLLNVTTQTLTFSPSITSIWDKCLLDTLAIAKINNRHRVQSPFWYWSKFTMFLYDPNWNNQNWITGENTQFHSCGSEENVEHLCALFSWGKKKKICEETGQELPLPPCLLISKISPS